MANVKDAPWEYACEPFRIADGLYYVGNTSVSAHLIDTGSGLILIDTAYPQTVYLLLESIRRLGFDPADVKYVIHSHAHYDHFGGTRAFVELTGAETFLGEEDVEIIWGRPGLSWGPEYGVEFREVFEVDHTVKDGDTIELGGVSINCLSTPGHTPGTISYFFTVEADGKERLCGFHGGPGTNTLTRAYLDKYDLPASRRDDFLASLGVLRKQPVELFLGIHPGQNDTLGKRERMAEGEPNPFIDPVGWKAFLDRLARNAEELFAAEP